MQETYYPVLLCAILLLIASACRTDEHGLACSDSDPESLDRFVGTYGNGDVSSDTVVTFAQRRGTLLMHPALWSGPMVLRRVTADSFVVPTHPRFGAVFIRGADGCVTSARVHGLSQDVRYERLNARSAHPVQLLLAGQPQEAARQYVASDPADTDRFVHVGRRLLRSAPTRIDITVAFFTELSRLLPDAPAVHAALGDALMFMEKRAKARQAYDRALALDPSNEVAITALRRLGALPTPTDAGWQLPFTLDKLFAPPQPADIDSAWARWKRRDLDPREAEVVLRRQVDLDGVPAEARVIAHRIHGLRHVGVVIVPEGATGTLPVLAEAKGVSPSFFPLEVPDGLTSPDVLAEARGQVIYVAPGFRGERVIVGSDTLTSEGDRSDAWDGASDDLIALLRVALDVTPEADTSRVCVFGRSRGGTVALLSGIREQRVDCVVSWAAPTDWFSRMDLDGWTQRELVEDGLRNRAVPGETGGQFINYFLSSALAGRRGLRETRLHLIASSPLYFAERLPLTQAHWGLEDTIVPSVNGKDLVARYKGAGRAEQCLDVHFHPKAGHDQDRLLAPIQTRAFLLKAFGMTPGEIAACR